MASHDQDIQPLQNAEDILNSYYEKSYKAVHGNGCMGGANSYMHKKLEKYRANLTFEHTLELGCGNLEHFSHVTHNYEKYISSDIRYPVNNELVERIQKGKAPKGLEFSIIDAANIPFADSSIDRIVAGCLIAHMPDPFAALKEWSRVCKPGGVIDFMMPCEPGFALRAIRFWVSERKGKKVGVPRRRYQLVNSLDHVNYFTRIDHISDYIFNSGWKINKTYYPFRLLKSWNFNAFVIYSVTKN